jgi:hypothetical protein
MGAIAKGKVNASEAEAGMRIIVKVSYDAEGHATIRPSSTKTGEGVFVARIIEKGFRAAGRYEARGKYVIHTSAGSFDAAPIQTMWLAPEDPAGIKRAYAEALIEDAARPVAEPTTETVPASEEAGAAPAALTLTEAQIEENAAEADALALAQAEAARDENEAPGGIYHGTVWASPTARRALHTQMVGRVLRLPAPPVELDLLPQVAAGKELVRIADLQVLTLDSQACKVSPISSEDNPEEIEMAQNLTHDEARNYPLSTGETADLIALVSSVKPSDWVQATEAQPVGTVVYAYAMGELRRGVVVKNTPTKTLVALTTAAAAAPGGSVRVQTATELHTTVYVAPAAAPVQEAEEAPADETPAECPVCGGPLASDGVCADDECGADEDEAPAFDPEAGASAPDANRHASQTGGAEDLTLNSHAGKVMSMNNDANATQTETPAVIRETTGSSVVKLLERVHERIRQNHPNVPAVVIVTGAGIGVFGGKWGHFRPQGWTAQDEDKKATHIHEMFMAGETLAKGSRQVLQTMLHESAHAECEAMGLQDTSRQGRWHNKTFLAKAQELGLEYRKDKANPQIGYSEVVLKDETVEEYRDLLDALDAEIHLMVRLPGWLGGAAGGDDDEDQGGENMGKAPKTGDPKPNTNNIKCVCDCEEPNIIRMSRKVLAQGVVRCDECEGLFHEAA